MLGMKYGILELNGADLFPIIIILNEKCVAAAAAAPMRFAKVELDKFRCRECIRCSAALGCDRFTIKPLLCINEDASLLELNYDRSIDSAHTHNARIKFSR